MLHAFGQALLGQPVIVEHLGQVLVAGIADEGDDAFRRRLLAAIFERGRKQRARGRAGEDTFLGEQVARRRHAEAVRDRISLLHQRQVGVGRHEILADPFDRPASGLDHLAGLDQRRQHRADRIGEHHFGLRRILREEAAEPCQRAAGADADDHRVDVAVQLLPDLRPGRRLVRQRVGRIGELVDVERAGRLRRDAFPPCPGNIPDAPCRRRSASA